MGNTHGVGGGGGGGGFTLGGIVPRESGTSCGTATTLDLCNTVGAGVKGVPSRNNTSGCGGQGVEFVGGLGEDKESENEKQELQGLGRSSNSMGTAPISAIDLDIHEGCDGSEEVESDRPHHV